MAKHIDAEKLIVRITEYKNNALKGKFEESGENAEYFQGKADTCADILQEISSLQQEQPEDLEKEIDKEWKKCNPIDEGMGVETANIHIEAFDIIARHFYELGKNSK